MTSSGGNFNPSSSQPSSSVPPTSESLGGKAPKEKMKVTIEMDGSVVGEYSKIWSTRTGDFVIMHIPISYNDFRKVSKNFKDDVWNALMVEFELDVSQSVARPFAERSWPQKFRTHKNNLRNLVRRGHQDVPKGVDPLVWNKFVENERDPTKVEQIARNVNNRKQLKIPHTLGRRSYAQKSYLMRKENPGKYYSRVDKWLAAHEHSDGSVLESAKSKYDEIKAIENIRKSSSLIDEGCSNNCEDFDNDELTQVFGKEKREGVHAVGSRISKRQLLHIGLARSKIEEKKKVNEEVAALEDKIISHVDSKFHDMQGIIMSLVSKLSNVSTPPVVTTPPSEFGSNSVNLPTHLAQNLNNVFAMTGVTHSTHPMPPPTDKPPCILFDKFGKQLAKGYIVTDATANVCHGKQVGIGEKKVYIEEVFEPDARLWDSQGEHNTLASVVQGGFVIWLKCWLKIG